MQDSNYVDKKESIAKDGSRPSSEAGETVSEKSPSTTPVSADPPDRIAQVIARCLSDPMFLVVRALPCLIVIAVFVLVALIASVKVIGKYFSFPEAKSVELRINKLGAWEWTGADGSGFSWFLLSPTGDGYTDSPWIDTGIQIGENESVVVRAYGRATMAIHHIVKCADNMLNPPPRNPWISPDGFDPDDDLPRHSSNARDSLRRDFLIAKGELQGRLIGVIADRRPEDRPDSVFSLGSWCPIRSESHDGGTLWLAVNEIWLDKATRDSLSAKDPGMADHYRRLYSSAWFDDNTGAFLVVVEHKSDES